MVNPGIMVPTLSDPIRMSDLGIMPIHMGTQEQDLHLLEGKTHLATREINLEGSRRMGMDKVGQTGNIIGDKICQTIGIILPRMRKTSLAWAPDTMLNLHINKGPTQVRRSPMVWPHKDMPRILKNKL